MSARFLLAICLASLVLAGSSAPLAGPKCKNRFPKFPLCKFVDDLATFKPAVVDATAGYTVKIGAYQIYQKFHRDLPATKQYAYGVDQKTAVYPGPVIIAKKGVPNKIYWENKLLDRQHMFTVDYTLMEGIPKPKMGGIPVVPHRHGGESASDFDGHPQAWFTQFGEYGPTFKSRLYRYNNQQNAAMLWFHDHALGWTRLNTVAGLAGLYIITDPKGEEKKLGWLPAGKRDVPLAIADRLFFANGSIDFPNVGVVPKVHPNWTPEYIGNHIVVNGKVWPFMKVRRAMYRFRLLGVSNARFFNLKFECAGRGDYPNFFPPLTGPSIEIIQIGADGGYLSAPARMSSLLLIPGERADILVDFNSVPAYCKDVILTNNARAPYPAGEPVDRNTGVVMRFVVTNRKAVPSPVIPSTVGFVPKVDLDSIAKVRFNTLVEIMDPVADLPVRVTIDGKGFMQPVTEIAREGTAEVWNIINLSADAHAMHIHLIQHRALWRRPFNVEKYEEGECSFKDKRKPSCYTGKAMPVKVNERGWKDTTLSLPGQVLTVYAPFYPMTGGKKFLFDPSSGPGYVWHCHMLDHEDNDMMRPFRVVRKKAHTRKT